MFWEKYNRPYPDLDTFLKECSRSDYFYAEYRPQEEKRDRYLSERLLFTQSNARVLLGQDTAGRLYFIGAPCDRDYPLPVGQTAGENHLIAEPGMFYQTDLAMLLGKLCYTLLSDTGEEIPCYSSGSKTVYCDDFLPVTSTSVDGLNLSVFSIAPVLEEDAPGPLDNQLPGPSGAVYGLHIQNQSGRPFCGRVRLTLERSFIPACQHNNMRPEERAEKPAYAAVEQNMLLLWHPSGAAGIDLFGGHWEGDNPMESCAVLDVSLAPGESKTVETFVAVSPRYDGVRAAMGVLLAHRAAAWINITSSFWKSRLGALWVDCADDSGTCKKSLDFYKRCVIDNFNCVQTDEAGRVLVHWQGAPSHNMARMWGIDVEPTSMSFLSAVPELSFAVLQYMATRNRPRYSPYGAEHSLPILVAPLVMAGRYLKYTADRESFLQRPELLRRLDGTYLALCSLKHGEKALYATRYSSDGPVGRRYDLGANLKAACAFRCYADLLHALGRKAPDGKDPYRLAEDILRDIREEMVCEGLFGKQFTGGTNLQAQDDFYIREDICYYDGEDSFICMAPVCGLLSQDDPLWRNYTLFAKSLACSNFDAEMDALRWFPHGGAVDGSAYASHATAAVTRKEQMETLKLMFERSTDENGSLYWWPLAKNCRRRVARCSQGQGFFAWYYLERVLGLKIDAVKRTLQFAPKGLPQEVSLQNIRLGAGVFSVFAKENNGVMHWRVENHNAVSYRLSVCPRPFGAGAAEGIEAVYDLPAGKAAQGELKCGCCTERETGVPQLEAQHFSGNGVVWNHYGHELPAVETMEPPLRLMRMVLVNGRENPLTDITVTVTVPGGIKAAVKSPAVWNDVVDCKSAVTIPLQDLPGGKRGPCSVWLAWGAPLKDNAWFEGHPFHFNIRQNSDDLVILGEQNRYLGQIEAKVSYTYDGIREEKTCLMPVREADEKTFREMRMGVFGKAYE